MQWDDLRSFLAVARAGGLSGAAAALGISPATVGRHVGRLEGDLGQRLFQRSASGYVVTHAGRELLGEAEAVEAAVQGVVRWRDGQTMVRTVRISAGSWISHLLVRHWDQLCQADDPFSIAFVSAEERVDIARRHADIGVRNARPVENGLAGRALCDVAFAAYRKRGIDPDGWIATPASGPSLTPSARWVRLNHASTLRVEANTPRLVMELVEAGAGKAVLPCFVGDTNPALERVDGVIDALTHKQWLVAHHEVRHTGPVRAMLKRIERVINHDKALMAGRKPS